MGKKIFLSDFDGTLVSKDILDVICGIVGKEQESRDLNMDFVNGKREGLPTLKKRIDFLKGVSMKEVNTLLRKEPYLLDGAQKLFKYLRDNNYITVLHSGNLLPVLDFYKSYLNIDYTIGTSPRIKNDTIQGIELEDFNGRSFKVDGCNKIIEKYGFSKNNIIALGDSPADKGVFGLAGLAIAINPKGDIADYSDHVVEADLSNVVSVLENA